jgi:hypothetical protein
MNCQRISRDALNCHPEHSSILNTPHVILNEVKDLAAEGDASEIVTAPITARFVAVSE